MLDILFYILLKVLYRVELEVPAVQAPKSTDVEDDIVTDDDVVRLDSENGSIHRLTVDPTRLEIARLRAICGKTLDHFSATLHTIVFDTCHRLLLALVKGCRHYFRRKMFTSDINLNFLALICKLGGQKREPDVLFQEWSGTSRRDVADTLVADINVIAVACDAGLSHFESNDAAARTFLLGIVQSFATDELAFLKLRDPAQVCFERRDVVA